MFAVMDGTPLLKNPAFNNKPDPKKARAKLTRDEHAHCVNLASHSSDAGALHPGIDRAKTGCQKLGAIVVPEVGLTRCMVRPCVARGLRRVGGYAVLHQCIRPLIGAFELRAIMDISARAISLPERLRIASFAADQI
jgi:hypothetical protein